MDANERELIPKTELSAPDPGARQGKFGI